MAWLNFAMLFSAGLALCAAVFGPMVIFPRTPFEFGLSATYQIVAAAMVGALGGVAAWRGRPTTQDRHENIIKAAAGIILLYCISDIPYRLLAFPQWSISLPYLIVSLVCLTAVGFAVRRFFSPLIFVGTVGVGFIGLLNGLNGGLLYTDDHPCFLYRLMQLKDNFPFIPFYNPDWNGGVEAREFFPSGVLNFFLLFAPFIYTLDLTSAYSTLIAALLFLVIPAANFGAALLALGDRRVALISGGLSLLASLAWYRWALAYGTVGFITAAGLIPLNIALIARMTMGRFSWFLGVLTTFSFTLMALWSPSLVLMSPALLYGAYRFRSIESKRAIAIMGVALAVINIPWMTIFVQASNVGGFVSVPSQETASTLTSERGAPRNLDAATAKIRPADHKTRGLNFLEKGLKTLRDNVVPINPFLLFLGIPGIIVLVGGNVRSLIGGTICWALLLGTVGPMVKPQLELERMFVIIALLLCLPTGRVLVQSLSGWSRLSRISRCALCCIIGIISITPLWLFRITQNQTSIRHEIRSPLVTDLVTAIQNHAQSGRVLFAGFTLHEIAGGHVAPLAEWSGVPLVASSYQHDRWHYVDVIPKSFLKRKDAGILEYLDLMNIGAIVTHDKFWLNWYSARPEYFEKVWEGDKVQLFRRRDFKSNYFLDGSGEVLTTRGNSITLRLATTEATLKFNFLPFLKVEGCTIEGDQVSRPLTMIRLTNCPIGTELRIEAKSSVERFF